MDRINHKLPNSRTKPLVAVALLGLMALFAVAGPSGILAWQQYHRLLQERQQQIVALSAERGQLKNRVDLLDPRHADPDLAGELLRAKLNVIHPDEVVLELHR